MIVDPCCVYQYALKAFLKQFGAEVHSLTDGDQACKTIANMMASDEFFDIIIIDHIVPLMDGIKVTKNIRKLLRSSTTTTGAEKSNPFIILCPAIENDEINSKALQAGCNLVKMKPFYKRGLQ